jgi:hypothetical protein
LISDSFFSNSIKKLESQLIENETNPIFAKDAFSSIDLVDDWKYSTGPIYNPIPFRDQVMGFTPGKPVKRKFSSPLDAISCKNIYASGFIDGKLAIEKYPIEIKTASLNFYQSIDSNGTLEKIIKYNPINNEFIKLAGLNEIRIIDKFNIYFTGISIDGYYLIQLKYDSNNYLIYEKSYSKGWPANAEYFYHYDNKGNLSMITTPSKYPEFHVKIWPKSKDWKVPQSL